MRIQLDTTKKTIKVDEDVKLSKFMTVVKRLLPNGEWMDFTLETNTTIQHWSQPIVYKFYEPTWTYPWYGGPYWYNSGTCGGSGTYTTNTLDGGSGSVKMMSSTGISNATYNAGGGASLSATNTSGDMTATLKDGIYNVQV